MATRLYTEHGVNVVGVPKTIDNDLSATDQTFGFDTAIQVVSDACDRLHTTAESHHRNMLVEVMGRHAGWIALHGGIAGGADIILIPEKPFVLEEIVATLKARHDRGSRASLIVCAEGALPEGGMPDAPTALDEFGHVKLGGIGQWLESQLTGLTGFETRLTQLAYIQRGGTPTAFDRVLGTRLGRDGDRRDPRRPVRQDGGAPGDEDRDGRADRGDRRAADCSTLRLRPDRGPPGLEPSREPPSTERTLFVRPSRPPDRTSPCSGGPGDCGIGLATCPSLDVGVGCPPGRLTAAGWGEIFERWSAA